MCCTSRILNITFMYHPVLGAPKSNIREYLGDWKNRHWAIAAGVICGLGNTLQFMGGQVMYPFLHADMLHLAAAPLHPYSFSIAPCNRHHPTACCTGGRLCGCGQCASTPAGQHHLGSGAFWRVLQVGTAICPFNTSATLGARHIVYGMQHPCSARLHKLSAEVWTGRCCRSSKRTYMLLAFMLAMFVAAVGLLMGSAGHRS